MKRLLYNVIRVIGGVLAPGYGTPSYDEARAEASVTTRGQARRARRALIILGLVIVGLIVLVQVVLDW
jgi:hypothetical protein